jgi:hypothetical protein
MQLNWSMKSAPTEADAPLLESLWEDHRIKGLPVNALILAPWHGEASCFLPGVSPRLCYRIWRDEEASEQFPPSEASPCPRHPRTNH